MTQMEIMQMKLPDASEEDIEILLDIAKSVIINKRFPFGDGSEELEPRYRSLQIRIALEIDSKSGAEGQLSHSENGVSRTYSSAGVSPELLNEITPKGGVFL